jgi:hypothetical protein
VSFFAVFRRKTRKIMKGEISKIEVKEILHGDQWQTLKMRNGVEYLKV